MSGGMGYTLPWSKWGTPYHNSSPVRGEMQMSSNPFTPETPEWQLWAEMKSAEARGTTYEAEAARFAKQAYDAKVQAREYREALEKLAR